MLKPSAAKVGGAAVAFKKVAKLEAECDQLMKIAGVSGVGPVDEQHVYVYVTSNSVRRRLPTHVGKRTVIAKETGAVRLL